MLSIYIYKRTRLERKKEGRLTSDQKERKQEDCVVLLWIIVVVCHVWRAEIHVRTYSNSHTYSLLYVPLYYCGLVGRPLPYLCFYRFYRSSVALAPAGSAPALARLRLGLQPSSQARLQARLQARRLPLTSFSIRCTSSSDNGRFHGSNGMMKCWMPSATVHVSTYLRSLYISLSIIDNMQGKTGRRPTTRQPQAGGSCERKQNNRPTDRQESVFFDSADRPIDRSLHRKLENEECWRIC